MKFHHERDEYNEHTGVTVCDFGGVLGFSFCHPGRIVKRGENIMERTSITQVLLECMKPDQFNRKTGRLISEGRAKKLIELRKNLPEDKAMEELYSHKMRKRIAGYMERNYERLCDKTIDTESE